jgi:hypothetical protein
MLNRLFATALLVTTMTSFMLPTSVYSSPAPPGAPLTLCSKHGVMYPNGALYHEYIYFNHVPIRYDVYRCVYGTWIYLYSSDDP